MLSLLLTAGLFAFRPEAEARPHVIVVTGAPGTREYEIEFRRWADQWRDAAESASAEFIRIGDEPESRVNDRDRLRDTLSHRSTGTSSLWLVLIGHGTFDGMEAKFNLRGPDVSAGELAGWLSTVDRPLILINCASSSGPFINTLTGENRIVVTATRGGDEQNFARFGEYLADAITDAAADLDKDGQVSVLEAFLIAGKKTEEYYQSRSRLATEHALLDDNGDGLGTPADWFRGVRAVKRARDGATPDGIRAHQHALVLSDRERLIPPEIRQRRDRIERSMADLREQKSRLDEADYYARFEQLAIELATLYRDFIPLPEPPIRSTLPTEVK